MNAKIRIKLSADADASLVSAVEDLAQAEGRGLENLLDEALSDLLAKHSQGPTETDVISAYQSSHDRFAELYKKLAK